MQQQKPRSASVFHNVPVNNNNNGNCEYVVPMVFSSLFLIYFCCVPLLQRFNETGVGDFRRSEMKRLHGICKCFVSFERNCFQYSFFSLFVCLILYHTTRFDTHKYYHTNGYSFNLPYNLTLPVCDDLSCSIFFLSLHLFCSISCTLMFHLVATAAAAVIHHV